MFAVSEAAQDRLAVIDEQLVQPGDLTRSLCSPWQNDYRECACYYWAASRPDYVNVDVDEQGVSVGNHWLSVHREPREYVLDNGRDTRLLTYDDLFREWQQHLRFIVGGRDYPDHR
ncbi:LodA/GoxA family CTQ-dependent oxidase [Kitasatospora sp. NPDC101155]|uniref:LodA/GoxA family CTQ-dependent oxidase n=1 Tax=Kitasatospora sp. NPDC101155 TaxID=3364097 RepID=UPI0037F5280D